MQPYTPFIEEVLEEKKGLEKRIFELERAADFALAVLWGSDSDKNGAVKALEKVLAKRSCGLDKRP
jgi:hypothetical protein